VRFYIAQKIISANLHSADAECTAYTTQLLEQLEQTKADNPNEDAIFDEVAAAAYCEQFALQTFAKGERDMTANTATKNTADTLLAAATFLELLAVWNKDAEPEIKSKHKFAKYHAVRILKAIQAGDDPNLTNPVQEAPQAASPSALDPNDPDVQDINQAAKSTPTQNPYQAYVETGPNTEAFPSPKVSPPPDFPSAPTNYDSHRDVSPISQSDRSRNGSVASVGGGYFPRVNVPTFTADTTAPSLPTATSHADEPMADVFDQSTLPTDSQLPQAPQPPTPQNFYNNNNTASPAPFQPPPQPTSSQNPYAPTPQQPPYASPPPPAFQPDPQQHYQPSSQPPQATQQAPRAKAQYNSQPQQYQQMLDAAPQSLHQGPFKTDEESQMDATKHAKWAISALNFEDVNTAVKELRLALQALGAN
jgi:vacuolar protein sorting-associated protein VTA1